MRILNSKVIKKNSISKAKNSELVSMAGVVAVKTSGKLITYDANSIDAYLAVSSAKI